MDIFTTQLTRVVPVPIKPANLKVKALLKDAASPKLKEDPDHLENHEYYFENEEQKGEQYHSNQKGNEQSKDHSSEGSDSLLTKPTNKHEQDESKKNELGKDKHLDLYA
jgi:hypothetical protein